MSKSKEWLGNYRDTSQFKGNRKRISFCYGCGCMNCMILGVHALYMDIKEGIAGIWLGILFLVMVVISMMDRRKENNQDSVVVMSGIVNLAMSILVACMHNYWWIIFLILIEITMFILMNLRWKRDRKGG